MGKKQYFVYILTNKLRTVLYVGITSNLVKRIWEHKNSLVKGFTKKYNVHYLSYFEIFSDPENAIKREKQIKKWRREKKLWLIKAKNPAMVDLYLELV